MQKIYLICLMLIAFQIACTPIPPQEKTPGETPVEQPSRVERPSIKEHNAEPQADEPKAANESQSPDGTRDEPPTPLEPTNSEPASTERKLGEKQDKEPTREVREEAKPQEKPNAPDAGVEHIPERPIVETIPQDKSAQCQGNPRLGQPCSEGLGPCKRSGKLICDASTGQVRCDQTADISKKKPELCNGLDDDCDGMIDNSPSDAGKACQIGSQKGLCQAGLSICVSQQLICAQTVQPSPEKCNGKDDDCDGLLDETPTDVGNTCTVTGQKGECAKGTSSCTNGQIICQQTTTPKTEICPNQKDDDCDGIVDNACHNKTLFITLSGGNKVDLQTRAITHDNKGNVYYIGALNNSAKQIVTTVIHLGNHHVAASGALVVKLDSAGKVIWSKNPISSHNGKSYGTHIKVDALGNVYIAGYFSGALTFGQKTIFSRGKFDVFVAKLNSAGQWQWGLVGGSTGGDRIPTVPPHSRLWLESPDERPTSLELDTQGNVYVGGICKGQLFPLLNNAVAFILKLDPHGKRVFAKAVAGNNAASVRGIHRLKNGDFVVTGAFLGQITFGTSTLKAVRSWTVFAAIMDVNGKWKRGYQGGGSNDSYAFASRIDNQGNVYFFGHCEGTQNFGQTTFNCSYSGQFIAKLNSTGTWQWVIPTSRAQFNEKWQGTEFTVSTAGEIYMTGRALAQITLGTTTIPAPTTGQKEVPFVAKLSTNGKWLWADTSLSKELKTFVTGRISGSFTYNMPITVNGNNLYTAYSAIDASTKARVWKLPVTLGVGSEASPIECFQDSAGHFYLVGTWDGFLNVGSVATDLVGQEKAPTKFMVKYDAQGKALWSVELPQIPHMKHRGSIYISENVMVQLGNSFYMSVDCAPGQPSPPCRKDTSGQIRKETLIAQLTSQGKWGWLYYLSSGIITQGRRSIFKTENGNLSIAGAYKTGASAAQLTIGPHSISIPANTTLDEIILSPNGALVATKLNTPINGNNGRISVDSKGNRISVNYGRIWERIKKVYKLTPSKNWSVTHVSDIITFAYNIDSADNIYVLYDSSIHLPAGRFVGHYLIKKYDPDGKELWTISYKPDTSIGNFKFTKLRRDANDNFHLLGETDRALTFGTITVPTPASLSIVIATFNSQGKWTAAKTMPLTGGVGTSMILQSNGRHFILGKHVNPWGISPPITYQGTTYPGQIFFTQLP